MSAIPADIGAELYAEENLVINHPRMSGPYPRSLLIIAFVRNASQSERQRIIDSIDGQVVGGNGVFYYVVVPSRSGDDLWTILDQVNAFPHVEDAGPEVLGFVRPASDS